MVSSDVEQRGARKLESEELEKEVNLVGITPTLTTIALKMTWSTISSPFLRRPAESKDAYKKNEKKISISVKAIMNALRARNGKGSNDEGGPEVGIKRWVKMACALLKWVIIDHISEEVLEDVGNVTYYSLPDDEEEFPSDEECTLLLRGLAQLADFIGKVKSEELQKRAEALNHDIFSGIGRNLTQHETPLEERPLWLRENMQMYFSISSHPGAWQMEELRVHAYELSTKISGATNKDVARYVKTLVQAVKRVMLRITSGKTKHITEDAESLNTMANSLTFLAFNPVAGKYVSQDVTLACGLLQLDNVKAKAGQKLTKATREQLKSTSEIGGMVLTSMSIHAANATDDDEDDDNDDEVHTTDPSAVDDMDVIVATLAMGKAGNNIPEIALMGILGALESKATAAKKAADRMSTAKVMDDVISLGKRDKSFTQATKVYSLVTIAARTNVKCLTGKTLDEFFAYLVSSLGSAHPNWWGAAQVVEAICVRSAEGGPKILKFGDNLKKAAVNTSNAAMKDSATDGFVRLIGNAAAGHLTTEQRTDVCQYIFDSVNEPGLVSETSMAACTAIMQIGRVSRQEKGAIPKHVIDWVKKESDTGGQHSRTVAVQFMDEFEGRSLKAVYISIEEQNANVKNACQNFAEFKVYLDENISQLKEFIAESSKKLPVPYNISVRTKLIVRKVIQLHFACNCDETAHRPSSCLFSLEAFYTESEDWGRWLKIGLSAAKLGKAVIGVATLTDVGAVLGVVDTCKSAYDTYCTKDDDDFQTFISEPFLTSNEQDRLIEQLRKAGFFNHFSYDAQTGEWVCRNCAMVYAEAGGSADRTNAKMIKDAEAALKEKLIDPATHKLKKGSKAMKIMKVSNVALEATNVVNDMMS
jgi:hypothetical protein